MDSLRSPQVFADAMDFRRVVITGDVVAPNAGEHAKVALELAAHERLAACGVSCYLFVGFHLLVCLYQFEPEKWQ